MQRYRAVIRSGDAMMVPDDHGYYVTRLDAFAYAEQRVREERESIAEMVELMEFGVFIREAARSSIADRIRARGAKEPECCCHKPGMERPAGTPCAFCPIHGERPEPKPLEKLTPHAEGEAVKITWEDVHRINALIDAVEALRRGRGPAAPVDGWCGEWGEAKP